MNFNGFSIHIGNGLFAGQVFDLLGGMFLLLIGATIFYTLALWRIRGRQVEAEIIGVRRRGPYFHGVYRYALSTGGYGEATSVQGNNSSRSFETGRRVPIQVMPDKPDEARERRAPLMWTLAIAPLLSGAWLLYRGATVSSRSPLGSILMVLLAGFAAYWLWTRVKSLLAKIQPVAVPEPWSALPIETAESLGSVPQTSRLRSSSSKSRRTGVIFVVLGAGIFALAIWQARDLLELRHGVRTSGIVLELSEGSTGRNSDTFLFPVVQYAGQDGRLVRFHDHTGARPSPFNVGDTVPVIYLQGKPTTATIDRGLSNWEPLAGLAIMAVMLTGLGLAALRGR